MTGNSDVQLDEENDLPAVATVRNKISIGNDLGHDVIGQQQEFYGRPGMILARNACQYKGMVRLHLGTMMDLRLRVVT